MLCSTLIQPTFKTKCLKIKNPTSKLNPKKPSSAKLALLTILSIGLLSTKSISPNKSMPPDTERRGIPATARKEFELNNDRAESTFLKKTLNKEKF